MMSPILDSRLTALIDDLFLEASVETALLASILLAAQESIKDGSIAALSFQVWRTHRDPKDEFKESWDGDPPMISRIG